MTLTLILYRGLATQQASSWYREMRSKFQERHTPYFVLTWSRHHYLILRRNTIFIVVLIIGPPLIASYPRIYLSDGAKRNAALEASDEGV